MTEVTIVDPHNIKPSKSGATRLGLWVTFDDQFEDAVQLLENPDHVPKRIITMAEMNEIGPLPHRNLLKPAKRLLEKATLIIIGVCLLGFIVYIAIGISNHA